MANCFCVNDVEKNTAVEKRTGDCTLITSGALNPSSFS